MIARWTSRYSRSLRLSTLASSVTFWWRTYRPRRISSLVRYSLIFRKTSRRSRLRLSTKTNKENPKARTDNRIEKTALTSRLSFQQKRARGRRAEARACAGDPACLHPGAHRQGVGSAGTWLTSRGSSSSRALCSLLTSTAAPGMPSTRSTPVLVTARSLRHDHDPARRPAGEGQPIVLRLLQGRQGVHSRGAVNWCQLRAESGGSQGLPSIAARMASRAVMPWAAAESR